MSKDARPELELSEDRETLTITITRDPVVGLSLDAHATDFIIHEIGKARAAMEPPHSLDDPRGKPVEAILAPRWAVESDRLTPDLILHIRDPRFGILAFAIPRDQARTLAETLNSLLAAPDHTPPSEKPS
jgi:hypothetical protein